MSTENITLDDIHIRTDLQPGDFGYVSYLHGKVYAEEWSYGFNFEKYVLKGFHEFAEKYDPNEDGIWVCMHLKEIVGFLCAIKKGDIIHLRFFIILAKYRGIGLGKRLMELFMEFMKEKNYKKAYLGTTCELEAAISLYTRYGFKLTEETPSTEFGKPIKLLTYELVIND